MRRSRRLRARDLPRLMIGGAVQFAGLFGGRYRRAEGAHVLARDRAGRILVVRATYLGPGWTLPGGHVERHEAPHHAAARETREETGLEVAVERLLLVDARRPRGVSFVFAGSVIGGEMDPQFGEISEVGWLSRAEIGASSPRLLRLLEYIEASGEGPAYLGL
jgi:ADP-ribose pyrophosphatase YjhB (NUDIX family)